MTLPSSSEGGGVCTLLIRCRVVRFTLNRAFQARCVPKACVSRVPCPLWFLAGGVASRPPPGPGHGLPSLGECIHPEEGGVTSRTRGSCPSWRPGHQSPTEMMGRVCSDAIPRLCRAPLVWSRPVGGRSWSCPLQETGMSASGPTASCKSVWKSL